MKTDVIQENTINKKIFIGIVAVMLMIPAVLMFLKVKDPLAINENRLKLSFPREESLADGTKWFASVSNWFNDRFGLRDSLIRVQHQFDYSLFKENSTLFFDDDGYLYYRSVVATEQPYNEAVANSDDNRDFKATVEVYSQLCDAMQMKDIDVMLMIPPQKNEVLLENQSQLPVKRPSPTAYERFEASISQGNTMNHYVSVLPVLREANVKNDVFYRCDFHWNDYGAAVAFGEVMNRYAAKQGVDAVYDPNQFEIIKIREPWDGGQLANLSPLFYNLPESVTCEFGGERNYTIGTYQANPDIDHVVNNGQHVFDGGVLFIGDSYTPPAIGDFNGTSSGLLCLFEESYFCHWDHADGMLKNIPENVKLVIIESIESNLYRLSDNLMKLQ